MFDTGWLLAGTGANEDGTGSGGVINWRNPSHITSTSTGSSSVSKAYLKSGNVSDFLNATNFQASIPADMEILGVEFRAYTRPLAGAVVDHTIRMRSGGARIGDNYADTVSAWPDTHGGGAFKSWGGDSATWGTLLTPSAVNSNSFGISISVAHNSSSPATIGVYYVQARIHYDEPKAAPSSMFMLFSVKERIKEILRPKPKLLWEPALILP